MPQLKVFMLELRPVPTPQLQGSQTDKYIKINYKKKERKFKAMSRATWQQGGKQAFSEDRKWPALQILTTGCSRLPRPGSWGSRGIGITGNAHGPGTLLPEHFLLVGGNKMAADVSNVRGNLCWCHGQGITSAYSYRMYHLQRIPSTTYSKNQKKSIK